MANPVTSDANLLTIYKTYYTDDKMEQLLFRNSPVAKKIKKTRITGKEFAFAMLYGRGGAVAGDFTVAVANAASGSRNAEMKVQPGRIFSVFNITQLEKLASNDTRGAYVPAVVDRMFGATEAMRKTYAAALYGTGYGEIGQIALITAAGATTFVLTNDAIIKMDVGTKFQVSSTVAPSSVFESVTVYTVTAISGNTVTFTPTATAVTGFIVNAWVEIAGCRDSGTAAPLLPFGLGAWIPSLDNRNSAAWTTYIGTAFNGVTRNIATDRLAGGFYLRNVGASEKYSDAISQGIRLVRRQGGVPTMIVLNDEDYMTVMSELTTQTNYWQGINTSDKGSKNQVTRGISEMQFAFSTSYLDLVYDDPYCPKGTCYIIDEKVIEFVGLSNVDTPINDGVTGNDPGAQDLQGIGDVDLQFKFIIDDYINIVPGTATADGPGAQVSLSLFGNWIVRNPAHCAVVKFN